MPDLDIAPLDHLYILTLSVWQLWFQS